MYSTILKIQLAIVCLQEMKTWVFLSWHVRYFTTSRYHTVGLYHNHAVLKHLTTKTSHFITAHFAIIHLVSNRKVLTILGTATDFLTEAFINVAAFLIRPITAIFFVITNLTLRNAFAIFAHKERAVTWLLWKTKRNTQLGVIY